MPRICKLYRTDKEVTESYRTEPGFGTFLSNSVKMSSSSSGLDLAQWLERLTVNAIFATVLGSIPASSDIVESEGRQMKQC
jgi:hypothetical protein